MRRAVLLQFLGLTLIAGCAPGPLGLPEDVANSGSFAIAVVSASKLSEVQVFDVTPELRENLKAEPGGTIELLLFEPTLAELGLSRGSLTADPSGSLLPEDRGAYQAIVPDGSWQRVRRDQLALADFEYHSEKESKCSQLSLEAIHTRIASSTTSLSARLVRLDDDRALVLAPAGLAIFERGTGAHSVEWSGPTCFKDGFLEGPESAIVADCSGSAFRASISGRKVTLDLLWTSPELGKIEWLAGGPTGGHTEVFGLRQSGVLERWDGSGTTHDELLEPVESPIGGLEWLGPGRVAMGLASSNRVFFYDDGSLSEEELPGQTGVTTVRNVEGVGLVVTDTVGQFYVRDGGWRQIGTGLSQGVTNGLAPFGEGFAFAVAGGAVAQFVPGEGACPEIVAGFPLDDLERLGDLLLGSGHLYDLSEVMLAVVQTDGAP